MSDRIYKTNDITDEMLQYADMYLKRVIINAKKSYFVQKARSKKSGITFVTLNENEKNLCITEAGYEKICCHYIYVRNRKVEILNTLLFYALMSLTEVQRTILLENLCFGITLPNLAKKYGLCQRTIEKHKHNAIEKIRRYMKDYGYE